jgi:hypothetical protein
MGFPSIDFAEIERRMLAHMISGNKDVQTSLTVNRPNYDEALTLDMMLETIEKAQKQQQDMDDSFVEALLACGFRVMINEDMPTGMVAMLPGNFKGSLRRAIEKARKSGDPRDGVFLTNFPPLHFQS